MKFQKALQNSSEISGGLYDPSHEHDSCGVGILVNISTNKISVKTLQRKVSYFKI